MRAGWFLVVGVAAVAVDPQSVQAHSLLTVPSSRSTADDLMAGPCGDVAAGMERTVFEAGSTTVLEWELTQNHGATFRIAFSASADEGFGDGVLGTRPDVVGEFSYSQEVSLPACTCEDCTLQLRQYSSPTMLEAYYSCADIQLVQPMNGSLPPCDASGSTSTSGAGTTSATDSSGGTLSTDGTTASPNLTSSTGTPSGDGESGTSPGSSTTSASSGSPTTGSPGESPEEASESGCGCALGQGAPQGLFWVVVGFGFFCRRRPA